MYSETLQKHFEQVFKTNNQEVKFKDILFEKGSYRIKDEYYSYLYNLSIFLKKNTDKHIKLVGYQNNEKIIVTKHKFGIKFTNRFLSLARSFSIKRVKCVYDYLIHKGVNSDNLSYVGKGIKFVEIDAPSKPKDRRVEIKIANK